MTARQAGADRGHGLMGGGCVRCGSFAGVGQTRHGRLCEEHAHRAESRGAAELLGYPVAAAGVVAALTGDPVVLLSVVPALFVVVALEVLAHAAVAAVTGLRVGQVTVGIGPPLVRFGGRPRRTVVRLVPVFGHVEVATSGDPRRVRWRLASAAYFAAGPTATVTVGLLATRFPRSGPGLAVAVAAASIALFHVAGLLAAATRPTNDLWNVVTRITRPAPTGVDTPTGWGTTGSEWLADLETLRLLDLEHRWADGLDVVRRLRAAAPDDVYVRGLELTVLTYARRYPEARAAAFDLLGRELDERSRANVENIVAWIGALTGEHPADMRAYADRALDALPDDAATLGTAALVAAREGRYADALALCDRTEPGLTESWQRATVEATRAYVAYRQGDPATAEARAAAARALDPACEVLDLLPPPR